MYGFYEEAKVQHVPMVNLYKGTGATKRIPPPALEQLIHETVLITPTVFKVCESPVRTSPKTPVFKKSATKLQH